MSDQLVVILDGAVAGHLEQGTGGRLSFSYEEQYRRRGNPTPLSLSMPTQISSHSDAVVRPWLWGLLPDNDAVLRRWAREFRVSASSAFALLSTPVGEDCAGAVRFVRPENLELALTRPGSVAWLTESEVGDRLRELRGDTTSWLGRSFTGQFSLAGAQAKTALLCDDGRWGVPSGSTPTTHILKPAISGLDDHDLNEHLCLDAARRAGLPAVRTTVTNFDGESAVVVDRYDRPRGEVGGIRRLHQEDLCQALGVAPTSKYQSEGGPTPARIAELLRNSIAGEQAERAVWRFVDALIYNWLVVGTDAHAKNYSLMLAGGAVRLAPLYDIASALPYGRDEHTLRMAMTIGGRYDVHPRHNNWLHAARDLGVSADAVIERVRTLATLVPDAFSDARAAPEVRGLGSSMPGALTDLVADRCRRCLALVR